MITLPSCITPIKLNSIPGSIGLLVVKGEHAEAISICVDYYPVLELPYTEETIGQAVIDELTKFPTVELDESMSDDQKHVSRHTLNINVARNTRRGFANCEIELEDGYVTFFYKEFDNPSSASHVVDGPLAVYSCGNKFGILKNPNFDRYGFRAKYVSLTEAVDI